MTWTCKKEGAPDVKVIFSLPGRGAVGSIDVQPQ